MLDVATREWVKTIRTENGPGHATLSPDGTQFFVVHHRDHVVTVIDAARAVGARSFYFAVKDGLSFPATG